MQPMPGMPMQPGMGYPPMGYPPMGQPMMYGQPYGQPPMTGLRPPPPQPGAAPVQQQPVAAAAPTGIDKKQLQAYVGASQPSRAPVEPRRRSKSGVARPSLLRVANKKARLVR